GKYRKIRYKGVVCDKCGVEVTRSSVRRERMGHIQLAAPVVHPWFLKTRIGLVLDEPSSKLVRVTYYAGYIVTSVNEDRKKAAIEEIEREFKTKNDPSIKTAFNEAKDAVSGLYVGKILGDSEYFSLVKRFGNVFTAAGGGEGIQQALRNLDLKKAIVGIEKELEGTEDSLRTKKLLRRLKLLKSMIKNNIKPEWMVLNVLPVLPPDLRPMVALDGGRYATSDLNDLYRRVINRNNRLKKLLELKAPDVIVINEKRMLQEAIDALIDNSVASASKPISGARRPLRSLADMLKGKQGRFRQNLLGKRVDYSGRSVIVVGPNLKLDECGLPKRMALELFRPFVISEVIRRGLAHNIRNSNRLIEEAPSEVWEILEEVIKTRVVLLNRQPTLHRLSVQAFKPILIEDLVVQIPPMVCSAFNADFDGDQMAVHLPLSEEAQIEVNNLMLSGHHTLLKPASGDPITVPTQDMVLGSYFLTKILADAKGAGMVFATKEELGLAYHNDFIALNTPVKLGKIETTYGRILFNEVLPPDFGFINETLNKKVLAKLISKIINKYSSAETKQILDAIKSFGFKYATKSGISWGMDDLRVPEAKGEILVETEKKVDLVDEQYGDGLLTDGERRARVIEIWAEAHKNLAKNIPNTLPETGSVYMIIDSGARGSWAQPTQMMGMKGLVTNPNGETIELPIKTSLKEGHTGLEYFISTHGSRKGLVDTALKTAEAGYLTRRLIDVAQDIVVKEEDCKTKDGIILYRKDGVEFGHSFGARVFSRTAIEDIKSGRKVIVKAGEIISHGASEEIEESKLDEVKIRSVITCKTLYGICAACYGLDLGNNQAIKVGEAVGIVAAQSIGEPGTQLTLRTRHAGGVAGRDITSGLPRVEELFEVRPPKGRALISHVNGTVSKIEEKGSLKTIHITVESKSKSTARKKAKEKIVEYMVVRSVPMFIKVGDKIASGDVLTEGSLDLRELFLLKGKEDAYRYIIKEVQRIYVSEGSSVNNKHIEVMIRQLFGRVKITSPGDTDFVVGDVIDKSSFIEVNQEAKDKGKEQAKAEEILLGVTRAALAADGFLAAASFQETARVLINAATEGRVDHLRGLKENAIIGRRLPIGVPVVLPEEEIGEIADKQN
ncbi:MAG TPA: DNA-directed RNA polymerase subunit beta', partial [Candidatus Paceibacterota bacterium]